MVINWLSRRFGAQSGRSESDIQFYDDAQALVAKKTVQPDHCTGEAYQKVGNAFILNVLPNLSRPLPPLEAATDGAE